jgi:hypothetical protein
MSVRNIHTYLFKAGLWRAEGQYYDESGSVYPVEGESRITHRNALWYNESDMRISGSGEIGFSNDYEIVPFHEGGEATSWTSTNDALGKLSGQFVLAGDAILSLFQSEDGAYRGTESLLRISDVVYRNWGTLLCGRDKLSSWMIRLNRT